MVAPASASKWQMGFNSSFNPYPANVYKMVGSCLVQTFKNAWPYTCTPLHAFMANTGTILLYLLHIVII
jgi:hypothetical protein